MVIVNKFTISIINIKLLVKLLANTNRFVHVPTKNAILAKCKNKNMPEIYSLKKTCTPIPTNGGHESILPALPS